MAKARINGIEINYRESGSGFPILFIHGFTGNLSNWAFQMPALNPHFRPITYDQRGHGHSDKPTRKQDYSMDLMADDAFRLLQHLEIEQCYVAGHSMGGMVAQQLVLEHPEAVQALVLVDTAAEVPDGVRTEDRGQLLELAKTEGMEAVFDAQLDLNPLADQLRAQPILMQVWRQQFLMTSPDAYVHCARAMIAREPLLDKLPAIEVPTLIVCGENDEPFLEPSLHMHQRIPGSELVIIPGVGHTPQVEKAGEFNRIHTTFLTRVHEGLPAAQQA